MSDSGCLDCMQRVCLKFVFHDSDKWVVPVKHSLTWLGHVAWSIRSRPYTGSHCLFRTLCYFISSKSHNQTIPVRPLLVWFCRVICSIRSIFGWTHHDKAVSCFFSKTVHGWGWIDLTKILILYSPNAKQAFAWRADWRKVCISTHNLTGNFSFLYIYLCQF